ncbi:MAG: hypothetical protein ACHQ1D_01480 [Nitrososphaerales archaeon]
MVLSDFDKYVVIRQKNTIYYKFKDKMIIVYITDFSYMGITYVYNYIRKDGVSVYSTEEGLVKDLQDFAIITKYNRFMPC